MCSCFQQYNRKKVTLGPSVRVKDQLRIKTSHLDAHPPPSVTITRSFRITSAVLQKNNRTPPSPSSVVPMDSNICLNTRCDVTAICFGASATSICYLKIWCVTTTSDQCVRRPHVGSGLWAVGHLQHLTQGQGNRTHTFLWVGLAGREMTGKVEMTGRCLDNGAPRPPTASAHKEAK